MGNGECRDVAVPGLVAVPDMARVGFDQRSSTRPYPARLRKLRVVSAPATNQAALDAGTSGH